jgi:hypothetical protein
VHGVPAQQLQRRRLQAVVERQSDHCHELGVRRAEQRVDLVARTACVHERVQVERLICRTRYSERDDHRSERRQHRQSPPAADRQREADRRSGCEQDLGVASVLSNYASL